jgi:hypothetical protein
MTTTSGRIAPRSLRNRADARRRRPRSLGHALIA